MAPLLLWLLTIISIAASLLNLIRKMFLYRLAKYRAEDNMYSTWFNMFIVELPIETVIILANPLPFLIRRKEFNFTEITVYETDIGYFDNEMLQLAAIFKLFILLRALLTRTTYYTERAHRVCTIFNTDHTYQFVIRCIMRDRPFILSFAWLVIGVLYFGHAIRITEKPLKQATDRMDFSLYSNCVWAAFITMSTVGYGDFFPRTTRGRVVMVFCCLYGVVNLSLVVASVSQFLWMGRREEKAYILVKRILKKKTIREHAGIIINYCSQFTLKKKTDYREADKLVEKIDHQFEMLREAQEEYRALTTGVPIEDKLRSGFDGILGNLKDMKHDAMGLCRVLNLDPDKVLSDKVLKRTD